MPIPLAMMIPFMAAQSLVMGDAFGKGFQFGKRKISAKTNEEFNSLTMSDLVTDLQQEFKQLIPTMQLAIQDSKELQNTVIAEMIKIVPEFLAFLSGSITASNQPSIEIKPEAHAHSIDRPHTHSGTKTIIGTTTTNGITTTHYSDGTQTKSGTPTSTPKSSATFSSAITIYVFYNAAVSETKIRSFFKRAWPSATISVYRNVGTAVLQNTGKGTRKTTILIHYTNAFPLPKTIEILHDNYLDI